jgi:hypothetical protein
MAEGASVAGASAKAVAGRGGGAVAFSAVRKPPANADNVGGWGAEDLRAFYYGDEGKQSFNIRVNLAKTGLDQSTAGFEAYTVVISSCNFTVVKRGLQPHWNVSLSLDEV